MKLWLKGCPRLRQVIATPCDIPSGRLWDSSVRFVLSVELWSVVGECIFIVAVRGFPMLLEPCLSMIEWVKAREVI